jgi:hypothetical protein
VQLPFGGRLRFVYRHFPLTEMLPETAMRNALETGQLRNKMRNDFMGGIRSGVNGTPAFFINGVRHDGPYDYALLVSGIQMRAAADTRT